MESNLLILSYKREMHANIILESG